MDYRSLFTKLQKNDQKYGKIGQKHKILTNCPRQFLSTRRFVNCETQYTEKFVKIFTNSGLKKFMSSHNFSRRSFMYRFARVLFPPSTFPFSVFHFSNNVALPKLRFFVFFSYFSGFRCSVSYLMKYVVVFAVVCGVC